MPLRLSCLQHWLAVPAMLAAGPAWAAEVSMAAIGPGYTAEGVQLGAPAALEIELTGDVPARCRMTTPPVLTGALDFNKAGLASAVFGLDCNAPFSVRVRSDAGGFATQNPGTGVAARIAYEVGVDIGTDAGTSTLGWCRADALTDTAGSSCAFGAGGWSSGEATAINRTGQLSIRWNAPAAGDAPPLGQYRDTVVIEMAVRA
jgi:hypothetical protein